MSSAAQTIVISRWWALALLAALLLASCGHDDEERSSHARPWEFKYQYNHKVVFGYGGDAEHHMVKGWSEVEPDHAWTNDTVATLGFILRRSELPVTLTIKMGAMVNPPALPYQPVDVYANDEKIAWWKVAEFKTYSVPLPGKFTARQETRVILRFVIPNAISPAELGQNNDTRKLGLRVTELTISKPVPPPLSPERVYKYGDKIFFGQGGNADKFRLDGWSGPEREATWTSGTLASLSFNLPHSDGPVILCMKAGGMHGDPRIPYRHPSVPSQTVEVSASGQKIAVWDVSEEELLTAVIPHEMVTAPHNGVVIEFAIPDATSPASLGHNNDLRKLGLRVSAVAIIEEPEAFRGRHPSR